MAIIRNRRTGIFVGILLLCLALATPSAYGQAQARLTGTISDSSGAVIPGAEVTVTNVATGIVNTTNSNETGTYIFPFLAPGNYDIAVTTPGFKKFSQTGVAMETNTTRTIDVSLELGEVTETIEVTGAAPLLESASSTIGQLIEQASVINMPVESRRSASLVRLMGGVTFRDEGGAEQAPKFSMYGGRSYNQMWLLDGGVAQNMVLGVAMLSINPPTESLQEFKVESNNYSAEYGRAGGGLILMTTKSGTNEYHGNGYWYLRNDKLDARTFFAADKATLRYNIFGTSIGGPIKKDKAFFFFNYEGARRRDGVTISNRTVPRLTEKAGDFSARSASIKDPVTGDPFAGNIIPSSRIDPVSSAFLNLLPGPQKESGVSKAPKNNYAGNTVNKLTQNFFTGRSDVNITQNDRAYFKYSYVEAPDDRNSIYPMMEIDQNAATRDNRNHHVVASWFHNFSPNLIQEVRWSYMNRKHHNRGKGSGSGLNGQLGLTGADPDWLARLTYTGYSNIGQNNHERIQVPIQNNQFIYNVTKIAGNHTLKFGGEMRISTNIDEQNNAQGGRLSFNNRATDALAAVLLGWTNSGQINKTEILATRSIFYGGYFQDDWKVTPKLTLNLGLRWEMDEPRLETQDNRQNSFAFDPINPVSNTPGIVTFSGRNGVPRHAHDWDKNNWGPRFGFAYRIDSKTVIRGGYGIQYLGAYKTAVPNCCALGFSLSQSYNSPDGGFTPAFLTKDGLPAPESQPELWDGFGAVPVGAKTTTTAEFFQGDHKTGYMQQWNLTLQREIGFNSVIEAAYMANTGRNLGGNNVSHNMIPLVNGMGPAKQDQKLRRFPQFSGVNQRSPPWGNSTYHAVNLKWEKRYSKGLNFLMNYTFAKYLDDVEGNNEVGGGGSNGYTHIERRAVDMAYSGSHIQNRFVASTVWEVPVGKGRAKDLGSVANAVIGGWGIGAIIEFRDGSAYGVIEQTNRTNVFGHSNRPFISGNPELSSDRPRAVFLEEWFDTSVFTNQDGLPANMAGGVFGNAARTYCCGPGRALVDLSVHKWWNLTERFRLQFRTDFINLPNRPHFNNPNVNRQNANFGRITSIAQGSTPRRIQFALKLEY